MNLCYFPEDNFRVDVKRLKRHPNVRTTDPHFSLDKMHWLLKTMLVASLVNENRTHRLRRFKKLHQQFGNANVFCKCFQFQ